MDENKKELTFDESIAQVMQTLPPVLRDYLASGAYTNVAKNLMTKYHLRIDQGGVLERELMLLLMGIENPDEFTQALAEDAALDQETINGIAQDVNEQIFMPLRKEEEERSRAAAVTPDVQPAPEPIKVEPQIQQPAAPVPQLIAPAPARNSRLENKIPMPVRPANIASLPPKVAMPQVVRMTGSLGDAVRLALSSEKQPAPSALLGDHEEPHIDIPAVAPKMPPAEVKPPQVVVSAPVNLPGAMPPIKVPEIGPELSPVAATIRPVFSVAVPKVAVSVPPAPRAPITPITSYSADPYREPIDEPPTE